MSNIKYQPPKVSALNILLKSTDDNVMQTPLTVEVLSLSITDINLNTTLFIVNDTKFREINDNYFYVLNDKINKELGPDYGYSYKQKILLFENETDLLTGFIHYYNTSKEIMIGWNIIEHDLSVVYARCNKLGINVDILVKNVTPFKNENVLQLADDKFVIDYMSLHNATSRQYQLSLKSVIKSVLDVDLIRSNNIQYSILQSMYVMLIHKNLELISDDTFIPKN